MEKIEGRILLVLAVAITMLLSIVTIAPTSAQATTIGVEPDKIINRTLQAGQTFTVEVWIRNVVNLAGIEFKLGYNTTVLTATSIDYGGIFGDTYFLWVSTINDPSGYLHYSISEFFGEPAFTGNGRAAIIHFTVSSYGSSPLDLYEINLGDDVVPPNPIAHTPIDGYFNNKILGDIDGDGDVDGVDFGLFAPCYGSSLGQATYKVEADLDHDGDVDGVDFGLFAPNYGTSV